MTKLCDLLIVGAGPAGLTLAWKAASLGLDVIVVDRKRSSSYATYLTSCSLMEPSEWNLPQSVGQPIRQLYFGAATKSFSKKAPAIMINREKLLQHLSDKAQAAGARVLLRTTVRKVESSTKGIQRVVVRSIDETVTIKAQVYADCSGTGCLFANHTQLLQSHKVGSALGIEYIVPLKSEPHTIDLYVGKRFRGGYGWLFPLTNDTAILGYGTLKRSMFKKVRQYIEDMFEMDRVAKRVDRMVYSMNAGIFRTGMPLSRFHENNVILVGDCGLQGNPLVGEGIRFVMDAATMAAKATSKAIEVKDFQLLSEYSNQWVQKYYESFKWCYRFQWLVRVASRYDGLMDVSIDRMGGLEDYVILDRMKGNISPELIRLGWKKIIKYQFRRMIGL